MRVVLSRERSKNPVQNAVTGSKVTIHGATDTRGHRKYATRNTSTYPIHTSGFTKGRNRTVRYFATGEGRAEFRKRREQRAKGTNAPKGGEEQTSTRERGKGLLYSKWCKVQPAFGDNDDKAGGALRPLVQVAAGGGCCCREEQVTTKPCKYCA